MTNGSAANSINNLLCSAVLSCYILAAGGRSYLVTQHLFCGQHKKTLVSLTFSCIFDSSYLDIEDSLNLMSYLHQSDQYEDHLCPKM